MKYDAGQPKTPESKPGSKPNAKNDLKSLPLPELQAKLGSSLDGNIALFSHGQFGGVLAARWIGLPLAEARHFPLVTASLSIFTFNPHHPEVSVIALWNAASHDIFNTAMERA